MSASSTKRQLNAREKETSPWSRTAVRTSNSTGFSFRREKFPDQACGEASRARLRLAHDSGCRRSPPTARSKSWRSRIRSRAARLASATALFFRVAMAKSPSPAASHRPRPVPSLLRTNNMPVIFPARPRPFMRRAGPAGAIPGQPNRNRASRDDRGRRFSAVVTH